MVLNEEHVAQIVLQTELGTTVKISDIEGRPIILIFLRHLT